jgi:Mrp family chromosome partitioning ATPase
MTTVFGTVGKLIAVTSCKGGVGKSTVSMQLAYRLASRGHKVGLFDADVHGPSLEAQIPYAEGPSGFSQLAHSGWAVTPREHGTVKLMSFGWFSRLWTGEGKEVRVNGPAGDAMLKLLHTTVWGELDYLIIDSPPGTGDVPKAIATKVPLSGALVVTTPSRLAVVDVVRGIRMLNRFAVPILGLVENMASFTCDDCGSQHYPFGRGHTGAVLELLKSDDGSRDSSASGTCPLFHLPIVNDEGKPSGGEADGPTGSDGQLAGHFDVIAEAIEGSPAHPMGVVELPHGLQFHELPHWPTELGAAEYVASR